MFVGEQPGGHEDRVGHPFVGPAGHVFDGALDDAGIDRKQAFVTGAVKHFKFEPRGKRRLHKKPNASEIRACRPWLFREIEIVKPRLVVALGSTAAQSLMERAVAIGANRGHVFDAPNGSRVFVTVHPSSLLRAPAAIDRAEARAQFVKDLRALRKMIVAPALPRAD
jgi:DNA polymerase